MLSDQQGDAQLDLAVRCDSISGMFRWIEGYWQTHELPEALLYDAKLCLEELFANIHNYSGLSSEDTVLMSLSHNHELICLEIEDEGKAFNPFEEAPEPELGKSIEECDIGGLGVHLVKEVSERCEYQRTDQGKNHSKVFFARSGPSK